VKQPMYTYDRYRDGRSSWALHVFLHITRLSPIKTFDFSAQYCYYYIISSHGTVIGSESSGYQGCYLFLSRKKAVWEGRDEAPEVYCLRDSLKFLPKHHCTGNQ